MVIARTVAPIAAALWLCGCGAASAPFALRLPAGFPAPRVPDDNPLTRPKVRLGQRLFHDPRLSGNGTQACSGCHRPELAYTDGRATAVGSEGDPHPRSAMGLANVAYNVTLGWDDPTTTRLEAQARVPLFSRHPIEMGAAGREEEVLDRLRRDRDYERQFRRAFPDDRDPLTWDNLIDALASFERTLISGDSPYDRWAYRAEAAALAPEARAGARLFFSKRLGCFQCHAGFNLSGPVDHVGAERPPARFHNTGLRDLDAPGGEPGPNPGLERFTGRREDAGHFRAPSLRNVALTAPYMHDGRIPTLEAVIDHYAAGGAPVGRADPLKDPLLGGFELSAIERGQLVAFLRALTDEGFVRRARQLARN